VLVSRSYIAPGYDHGDFRIYNEYELRPGERLLRMTTTVGHELEFCPPEPGDNCNAACDDILYDDDCECPEIPARCLEGALSAETEIIEGLPLPDGENRGLLDLLMGDLPRPLGTGRCTNDGECGAGQSCVGITTPLGGISRICRGDTQKDAGIALGDMLLFGGNLSLFLPGPGFDSQSDFQRLFARGVDTLGNPLPFDAVYGLGDGVSYGYASPNGKVLVPIFGGSFSFGATASAGCTHENPGCLAGKLVRTERWMSIGNGDAASAREPLDKARGIATGKISGSVLRAGTGVPESGVRVFAFADPRDLVCDDDCEERCGAAPTGEALAALTVAELLDVNRCRTVAPTFLEGFAALETVAETDVAPRPSREGHYSMTLPSGRYILVAADDAGAFSPLAPVTVGTAAQTLSLLLPENGQLEYAIFDGFARPTAGRVVVGACFPGDPCGEDSECGGDAVCQAGACACPRTTLRALELGGSRYADGVLAYQQTATGRGTIDLPPGQYDVIFTHGPLHTVDRASVTIEAGVTTKLTGSVFRAVDKRGWSAADFHVHADPSLDSELPMRERVTSYLAEDMDFMSSSDHDILTRYEPMLEELKVRDQLSTQVGVEVSTQEIGHFIAWPLKYQEWQDGKRVAGNGAMDWRGLKPEEIFAELRGQKDQRPVVVEVPHPYSYFDYYGLDPVSMEPSDSLLSALNPLIAAANFSGEFDTMEVMNGKNADLIRRPTIGELRFYSGGLDALRAERDAGDLDEATYQRRVYQHSVEATRRILHRTPAEQKASLAGQGNSVKCLCGADGDCAAGSRCDPEKLECVPLDSEVPEDPSIPGDNGLCRRFRGVVDDWFNMLNRGVIRPVVGGSDTHDIYGGEAGIPRTMIRDKGTTGALLDEDTVRDAVLGGEVVVTNGPMITFEVDGQGVGSTVTPGDGATVELSVHVESAPWFDVDRVEVYRNGELIHWISGCDSMRDDGMEDPHGHTCIAPSSESPVAFDEVIEDTPDFDAWYVVIAIGIDGRTLAPVYSSGLLNRFGTFEVAQKIFDLIPALSTFRTPRSPVLYPTFPIGVTNPVFVDLKGDGWEPTKSPTSWCRKGIDIGCN
jgi:hypothetical protein